MVPNVSAGQMDEWTDRQGEGTASPETTQERGWKEIIFWVFSGFGSQMRVRREGSGVRAENTGSALRSEARVWVYNREATHLETQ